MKSFISLSLIIVCLSACSDGLEFEGRTARKAAQADIVRAEPEPAVPEVPAVVEPTEVVTPTPEPVSLPEPEAEPQPLPEPMPLPEPQPAPVPEPVVETPPPGDLFVGCKNATSTLPIIADVYELPIGTTTLPVFSNSMVKHSTVCLQNYDIPNQEWSKGFPLDTTLVEWFALRTKTKLKVATAGVYEFRLASDDGANLYIYRKNEKVKVIDNDGAHSFTMKAGSTTLTAGVHNLEIDWYQGPRYYLGLQLYWKVPGSTEFVIVPKSAFVLQ